MESLQLVSEPTEILGGHIVSLASGDILIAPESLCSGGIASDCSANDEVPTYMSVPVQVLQDTSFVYPVVFKNNAGNTFLLDPRQCGLIGGDAGDEMQPHYIIAPSTEASDGDQQVTANIMGLDMDYPYVTNVGNLVLGETSMPVSNNTDMNPTTVLQLGGQVLQGNNKLLREAMCFDMSQLSIVTSNGVVSYMTTPSGDSIIPFPTSNNDAAQEQNTNMTICNSERDLSYNGNIKEQAKVTLSIPAMAQPVKRGRGRPKKSDAQAEDVIDPPVGKPPYRCDTCGYEAILWGRLKRHKQSHLNEKPHKCPMCPVSFNMEANLTLHMATHDQEQLKCPECQRIFSRVASLRSHLMLHEREDNLFCTECGDEFALQYQLDSHVMEHQEEWVAKNMEKVYECQKCQRQFTRSSALKEHMREHIKVKHSLVRRKHDRSQDRTDFSQKCNTCDKVFQKPSQLLRHMRIHTGEKPFSCEICGKAFNQKGSLQIHMTKHNGEKPHQCEFCNGRFSQKGNLRAHIQRVHAIPLHGSVTYRCTECPCLFKKLGSLNSHMGRVHSRVDGVKELKNEALSSEQMMQVNVDHIMAQLAALEKASGKNNNTTRGRHEESTGTDSVDQSITTTRPDSNDILQQAISKSGLQGRSEPDQGKDKVTAVTGYITLSYKTLDGTVRRYNIRQRKVGRVRWHQCSYCCKEFKKPSDLVRHIRIHTHEKPYKCPHCFRAFCVKSTLTAHIRTHGSLKHYTCPDCEKKFSSTSSLKVHQRIHNGERPFACSLCNRTFRTSGHRQTHWLSHCEAKGDGKEGGEAKKKRRRLGKKEEPDENLPEVMLQEPIVISQTGLVQPGSGMKADNDSTPRIHNCTQCTAAFRKASHLKMHLRTHSGERPFQCNICDRSFVSNGVLKAHILTHDCVKTFMCSVCSDTFSTHGSLKRHMHRHDENRPFMCPYCHKTFKHRMSCKKHMQIHKVEVARAVAQQTKDLHTQEFTVPVEEGFSTAEMIVPDFTSFVEEPLTSNSTADSARNEGVQLEGNKIIPNGSVITHTLLADASGTITLPTTLTQESIREIEETLNQQLSSRGNSGVMLSGCEQSDLPMNSTNGRTGVQPNILTFTFASASDAAHAEDVAAAANLAASENMPEAGMENQPKESVGVSTTSDLSATIYTQHFDQQAYDACAFPSISLQGDQLNLTGIEQGATLSANMEAILPQSCISERRRNQEMVSQPDESNNINDLGIVEDLGEGLPAPETSEQTFINDSDSKSAAFIHKEGNENSKKTDLFPDTIDGNSKDDNTEDQINVCELCSQSFKRVSQLKAHLMSVHGENSKPHTCTYCTRKFATASGLRLHERNHTGEKSFVCEHCTLSFASNGSLSRHKSIHSEKRPFSCIKCAANFRTQLQLRRHSKSHEPSLLKIPRNSRKVPTIILTEEQTSALANQNVDMVNTVSEKILIASALELSRENDSQNLRKYELDAIHPHQCKFCPKSFRKPSDLVRHIRTHTGEKPYQCGYCSKSFTVRSTLDSHQKTHIAGMAKLFSCHVCDLRFATKGSLKVHMRLHTGSKPFKCPLCSQKFRTSGHRKAHILSHLYGNIGQRGRKAQIEAQKTVTVPSLQQESTVERQQILTHQIITEDGSVVEVDASALVDGSSLELQINESLLQQLQNGGNVVIQPNVTVQFVTSSNEEGIEQAEDPMEDSVIQNEHSSEARSIVVEQTAQAASQNLPTLIPSIEEMNVARAQQKKVNHHKEQAVEQEASEISNMHFEIHTDEHGQIVNIQQAQDGNGVVLADIGDLNIAGVGKVSIDTSRFQILQSAEQVDASGGMETNSYVTLDISDIIVNTPIRKKGRTSKSKSTSNADGTPMHSCSICSKVFNKPSQLQRHVRIHTGERPFPCSMCWKAFNQKNALKAHMKRHTGERPFKCPFCDHAFAQRGNLKTHIGRAHPESSQSVSVKRRKVGAAPKNIVDDVTLNLDLDDVVVDLFPQMQNTSETEVV